MTISKNSLMVLLITVVILLVSSIKTINTLEERVELEEIENNNTKEELKEKSNQITKLEQKLINLEKSIDKVKEDNEQLNKELKKSQDQLEYTKEELKKEKNKKKVNRGGTTRNITSSRGFRTFKITAYCDNAADQEQWVGKTASGFSVAGKSRTEAQCIAVDPKVIPLGSKVQIEFDGEMSKYSGIYYARDVGGAIKGNKIDLFMGGAETANEVKRFGVRNAKVKILK